MLAAAFQEVLHSFSGAGNCGAAASGASGSGAAVSGAGRGTNAVDLVIYSLMQFMSMASGGKIAKQ